MLMAIFFLCMTGAPNLINYPTSFTETVLPAFFWDQASLLMDFNILSAS